jgi:hypothetical protein
MDNFPSIQKGPEVNPIPKETVSPLSSTGKRKQISAYLTSEQLQILKSLFFKLNSGEGSIEKSEIIGLGLELVSKLLGTQVPKYSNITQVREHLSTQISKYLSTKEYVDDNR